MEFCIYFTVLFGGGGGLWGGDGGVWMVNAYRWVGLSRKGRRGFRKVGKDFPNFFSLEEKKQKNRKKSFC